MLVPTQDPIETPLLELTPMIDMVFLLLIFFLVATTFQQAERETQVALPLAQAAGPISSAARELVVNVTESGEIIVNGRATAPADVQQLVAELVRNNPAQKVSIRGDRRTAYANVVRALDACKLGGVQEPYLDTVMRE